jgi:glycosyltransferase involved in cell wall biosynthesis
MTPPSPSKVSPKIKTKRKVLLVIRWPVGGIRTFARYMYRDFDPDEWDFTIVAPDLPEMHVLLEDLHTINPHYVPLPPRPNTTSLFFRILRLIYSSEFDLIHSHGYTSAICAAIPASLRKRSHLLTSHDVFTTHQFSGLLGKLKKRAMQFLLGQIDVIHSVSNDAQHNLLHYFPSLRRSTDKCVLIPNGIELERFQRAKPRDLRKQLALPDGVFLIGFFGRFMAQKGFRYLIKAIELLDNDFELVNLPKPLVLTFGQGGFFKEDHELIRAKNLTHCFKNLPFQNNPAPVIKGLDVVVMPSLWEACGLLAMETLVCGIPLITSDCIGLRELVMKTPTDVFTSQNAHMLYLHIKKPYIT